MAADATSNEGTIVDGLPYAEDRKAYIVQVLYPVLEEMLSDVLTDMPEPGPMDFMIKWLQKRSGRANTNQRRSIVGTNTYLKKEISKAGDVMQELGMSAPTEEAAADPEEEDEKDGDEDCDEIPESFRRTEQQLSKSRASVSAEAYGEWNEKKKFEPPKYPKTSEQQVRLADTLSKSFLFSALEKQDLGIILEAMKECNFTEGEKVITEGDDGTFLFVIEKGALDCKKKFDGDEEKVIRTCNEGDVFGELALLYNCPRAASVVAKKESVCWQLDRDTFNNIVKDASMKRREKYDNFLQSVTLFAPLDAYERSQIADSFKVENYKKSDVVVQQNQPGDTFYIVEEGYLYAQKLSSMGNPKVMDYKPGDYFGELALLNNTPRAASVVVASETARVLSISRSVFNKMLGPLQHILARQANAYA